MMMTDAMIADSSVVQCLARAGIERIVVMMATISAICCLARASTSGDFVVMTAVWGVLDNLLQNAPCSWFGAGRDHLLLEDYRNGL
jgi:hypothetical protein